MTYLNLLLTMCILGVVVEKLYQATVYQRVNVAIRVKEVNTGKIGC